MMDERDFEGNLLSNTEHLKKVGKIVRSLSVDELSQLINVLKGDMALGGFYKLNCYKKCQLLATSSCLR